jgi:hypothetical protein
MKGQNENKKVLVRGKEVFIGVDVHKERLHVQHEWKEKKFSMGVSKFNIVPCKGSLITSRIARSR